MTTSLPDDEIADRAAIAFLERVLGDRARGDERSLAAYLADQPPHLQARLAREWLLASQRTAVDTTDAPAGTAAPEGRIGPFRLLRELGRGGQGIVYLALDEALRRQVALKVLSQPVQATASTGNLRLQREAEALARLEHPGLARIYATGRDGETLWIAMRYVAGGNLQQQLAARQAAGNGPPRRRDELRTAALVIARAARALAAAHEAGVLHRDVKPANLLLDAPDQPVLVDFGLAHAVAAATPTLTSPGDVFGTLCYLAPERLAGAVADASSDVYSLGAVLFELLTLQRPFQAATAAQELQAIAAGSAPDVRTHNDAVPADLATVVATALTREPVQRYGSAAAFADDLERWRNGEAITARPPRPWTRLWLWTRRNRTLAMSLAACLLVLLAGLATTTWQWRATRQALADVHRLADLKTARELLATAETLWPAVPERVPAMQTWLRASDTLLAHAADHARQLAALPPPGSDATSDWQREQLQALATLRERLAALRDPLVARAATATELAHRTLQVAAADWQAAIARTAASPHYGGLRLPPQLGLLPLGPDPASGLEEFAHALSGEPPTRGSDGRLQLRADSAIVLVLIPGGRAVLGAERRGGQDTNVDAEAEPDQGPCHAIALAPFLLAKHELTQAQWLRHTGHNPATYFPGGPVDGVASLAHPVESVAWNDADRVVRELGLCLPTEAQWEWAYRAGSRTPFPGLADERGLAGRENLADHTAETHGTLRWPAADWLDDGYLVHAPVGSFLPNAFGLHDLGGNVREWCADSWEDYPACAPRAGDGLRLGDHDRYRVVRGACFASLPGSARAAQRGGNERTAAGPMAGVRAARSLEH